LGSGAASLRRQLPLLVAFHSQQVARSPSVSQVLRHQLLLQIHLLLLPPQLLGILYSPSVLLLRPMGDKSRSFLVAESGDADCLRDLFLFGNCWVVTDRTIKHLTLSSFHLYLKCATLRHPPVQI